MIAVRLSRPPRLSGALALGQYGPAGREIEIASTAELLPGDLIVVSFPFFSGGFVKYGSEETFTVTGTDPASGRVLVVDDSGEPASFAGGSREALLAKLRELTSFTSLRVIRPSLAPPGAVEFARGLGLPSGYYPVEAATFGELLEGDWYYAAGSGGRLFRILGRDADVVFLELRSSNVPDDSVGEVWTMSPQDSFFSGEDLGFRGTGTPLSVGAWAALAAAAAAATGYFLLSG